MLKTHGKPQDAQEPQKRRPGPGSRALARSCPWAQALAASFVVAGDPKAVPIGLPHMSVGPKLLIQKNSNSNRANMSNRAEF